MGEESAEPGRLRLTREAGGEKVACNVVVDCGGLEGCPDGRAAEADQLLERLPFRAGRRSEVPFSGELRLTQAGCSRKKCVDLATVLPDEPIHRAGGRSRLT
jgi:hypothetical protein